MNPLVEEIVSSVARLRIASLLSERPRTLKELSDLTGISVQAVLKHLEKLQILGILREKKVTTGDMAARKVYFLKGVHVGDFSYGDLLVVKTTSVSDRTETAKHRVYDALESTSEDILVQRRRIREQVRKLGRSIDDLVAGQERLLAQVRGLGVNDEEELLVLAAFTEESLEDAERTAGSRFGLREPRKAIDKALAKVKRIG